MNEIHQMEWTLRGMALVYAIMMVGLTILNASLFLDDVRRWWSALAAGVTACAALFFAYHIFIV
jgi:hypothetical protein